MNMIKKTLKQLDVEEKKVLVRCDFNVPLKSGKVADDNRIKAVLPTIEYLVGQRAKVVLCSHLGRPKGKPQEEFSLGPVALRLTELLNVSVQMLEDCIGDRVKSVINHMKPGDVVLLENTRFHEGEKSNDPDFAAKLADGMDLFVNDAFGTVHRAHASTEGVARHLPSAAGFLMEREIEALTKLRENPVEPVAAIFGGVKISDKIGMIEAFLDKSEALLVGGSMANMFFKVQGLDIGDSFFEKEGLDTAEKIMKRAENKMMLPEDVVIAREISENAEHRTVSVKEVSSGWKIVDIGSRSIELFIDRLAKMKTIIWNGPLGVFEIPPFDRGTMAIAVGLADLDAEVYVGGGDSGAAVHRAGVVPKMTHVSTGGGAFLEFLEGKTLPGLAVLQDK